MLTDGHHGHGIPLGHIASLLSSAPAEAMGLRHCKGRIAIGLDADLAIVDLDREYAYERGDVRSSAGYSIYEGRRFKGQVVHTLVRGRFVVRDRTLAADSAGSGRYIKRAV
jgi:dihydropyrimidinase/allantoinase